MFSAFRERKAEEPDEDTSRSRSIVLVQRSLYLIRPDTMDRVKLRGPLPSPLLTFPLSSLDSSPCLPLSLSFSPCIRNIDRRKLATASPPDSWRTRYIRPTWIRRTGISIFIDAIFRERRSEICQGWMARGWPRASIYIYILNVFIYKEWDGSMENCSPVAVGEIRRLKFRWKI